MINLNLGKKQVLSPVQIIVIGFAAVILLGGILLALPAASDEGGSVGFLNALFTSASAVCVTGLAVVDTGTYWSNFGKVVILILIQVGGLGFMSMATLFAMLIGKKISLSERLIIQEALNQYDLSGLVRLTRHILIGTLFIEFLGAFFMSFVFIPEYGPLKGIAYSIFHSISAFCNAGFDIVGNGRSLTPYVDNVLINTVVMVLIVIGGIGFTVILDVIRKRNFLKLALHSKIVILMTSFLIIFSFFVFFGLEYQNPNTLAPLSMKGKVLAAMFQAVSPRTAGFNTIDLSTMTSGSKFWTIILMFIGGSPASTAGGIKTSTLGVLLLTIVSLVKGREDVYFFKRRVSYRVVNKALAVVGIGFGVVITVTMILASTQPFTLTEILFEAVSAFGTVGLSLGITGGLSAIGKIFIIFSMFAGRVGALTILLALANKEKKAPVRYPIDKVIVG